MTDSPFVLCTLSFWVVPLAPEHQAPPSEERKESGGLMGSGWHVARAVFWVVPGMWLPASMGEKAPELLLRHSPMSVDTFTRQEVAPGNNCVPITLWFVRSEGRAMS